jgi:hypothetical protein
MSAQEDKSKRLLCGGPYLVLQRHDGAEEVKEVPRRLLQRMGAVTHAGSVVRKRNHRCYDDGGRRGVLPLRGRVTKPARLIEGVMRQDDEPYRTGADL